MSIYNFSASNQPEKEQVSSDNYRILVERKNQFINQLAHDIKTPLFGSAEVLKLILSGACGKLEPEIEHLILLLKQSNEEVLQIMQKLLEIYRYEAGAIILSSSTCDYILLVQDIIRELETTAEANESMLVFTPACNNLKIRIDQQSIQCALLYLLKNCLKYLKPEGKLQVTIAKQQNIALLTINASGLGISRHELDGIFFLAEQSSASKSYSPITSLELHLCWQIIMCHSGSINIEAPDQNNMVITIKLPI